MYWQKPERLTSEKETKLNWISARLLMLLQSQAFPKALDTILMQKDIREAWVATADGILPVETRYPSDPDLGLYGFFLLLFKTSLQERQLYKFYSEKSQRRNSPRSKITIKWLNPNRKPTESWAYPQYEDTSFPSTFSSVQKRQICTQVHKQSHALLHTQLQFLG